MRMKGFLKLHDFASKTGFKTQINDQTKHFPPTLCFPCLIKMKYFYPKMCVPSLQVQQAQAGKINQS